MDSPLIPPEEFVTRFNERNPDLLPYRTALDPLVIMAWHAALRPPERNLLLIVTGC